MEIVLWRNKDVLLGVELHALTCALPFFKLLSLAFILYSVAASLPKMSLSKKRKFDKGCRVFQDIWSVSYFFTEVNGIPVCLVCSQQVSVVKEYNIRVFRKCCSLNVLIIISR